MFFGQIVLFGLAGLLFFLSLLLKPRLFYPLLIFSVISTSGLMIKGHCFVDEFFLACILGGGLAALLLRRTSSGQEKMTTASRVPKRLFVVFALYMIAQSVRGIVLWEDWRIFRWLVYYFMLGSLVCLLPFRDFSFHGQDKDRMLLLMGKSAFLGFILYLGFGVYCEKVLGISRFALQGIDWAGSAYAVFPLVIGIPVGVVLINKTGKYQLLGALLFLLMMIVALYYDSRTACLVILALIISSVSAVKWTKTAALLLCFSLLVFVFHGLKDPSLRKEHIDNFCKGLAKSSVALWSPPASDLDRSSHLKASASAVEENWKVFFFGYGVHSHRVVMKKYLEPIYKKCLPDVELGEITRTMFFPALLVDTGWCGILLIVLNFMCCGLELFRLTRWRLGTYRYVLLAALGIISLWPLVSNIQDVVLFYFLIMPGGPLVLIAGHERPENQKIYEN